MCSVFSVVEVFLRKLEYGLRVMAIVNNNKLWNADRRLEGIAHALNVGFVE